MAHQRRTHMSSIKNKLFNDKFEEQPVQDESDGLLFFHGHSLWTVLKKVEEFYECTIYGVLELQEVQNELSYYPNFDKEHNEHIKDAWDIPKQDLLRAMKYAYDNISGEYDSYQDYIDLIETYLIDLYTGGFADEK